MLCGQPYVPYADAKDGVFFKIFAHESKRYPGVADLSLLVIVILSGAWCFFSLDTVIDALVTMIVFVQFIGQSVGLMYFRWRVPADQHILFHLDNHGFCPALGQRGTYLRARSCIPLR